MELQGRIKLIGKTETFGAKGFRKREVVITTEEQYPQDILVEFVQDKTELLDKFAIDQSVKIGINVRGRCWTNPEGVDKYFNSIQGWRIDAVAEVETPPPFETTTDIKEETNDLPF